VRCLTIVSWRVFAAAVILASPACRGDHPTGPEPKRLVRRVDRIERELKTVDVSNGVDAAEAMEIASVYLGQYLSGCGGPDQAALVDQTWVVSLRIGLMGGRSDQKIEVDARTGGVRSDRGPIYRDFASFHDKVLADVARRSR
jgi:hypothetical protein